MPILIRRPRPPRVSKSPQKSLGQALAEFALVAPLLLLVFAAAADLGRAFYAYVAIENAAKEGAVFGARSPLCDDAGASGCAGANNVLFRVQSELDRNGVKNQDGTSLVPSVQCLIEGSDPPNPRGDLADCVEGDTYEVSLVYDFHLLTPILSSIVGDPLTLTSTSRATVFNLAFDPTPGLSVEKLVLVTGATNESDVVLKCLEPNDVGGDAYYRSPCLDSSTPDDPTDHLDVRFESGDQITYRVRVSNSGQVTLTGLTITDSLDGFAFWPTASAACPARPTQLAVGQIYQCIYDQTAPVTPGSETEIPLPNTITSMATNTTVIQDASTVVVERPAMLHVYRRISPYRLGGDGDGVPGFGAAVELTTDLRTATPDPNPSVAVWYWIKVWNEGAKPATLVQIIDSARALPYGANNSTEVCDAAPGTLDPGESFECRYQTTYNTSGVRVNTVSATSPDVAPDSNDTSSVTVTVRGSSCDGNNDRVVPKLVGLTLGNATSTWVAAGFAGSITSTGMVGTDSVVTQDQQAFLCQGRNTSITLTKVPTP